MIAEPLTAPTVSEADTGDNLSPVKAPYESLDVEETRRAFSELNSTLEGLADTVVCTVDQMIPYLASMQALLSQRGSKRKNILKKAGLPRWSEWVSTYCSKLDCSLRTIQRHIKQKAKRGGGSAGSTPATKKTDSTGHGVKLDSRQQAALVKAQAAANDLVAALKSGGDWQTLLAEYERAAVSPVKLDGFLDTLAPEPHWMNVLSQLVVKLEQFGDRLPVAIMSEVRTVERLLEAHAAPKERDIVEASGSDDADDRGYVVEERRIPDREGVLYAVIQPDSRKLYGSYGSRSEAEEVSHHLNTAPVFSIRESERVNLKAS